MTTAEPAATTQRPLEYLPVALFGSVMGLVGLSAAWRLAHAHFGLPLFVSEWIAAAAVASFLVMSGAYAVKAIHAPDVVLAEFRHPIGASLFGTALISLLLLPLVLVPVSLTLARGCWAVGAIGMLGFGWLMIDRWMSDRQQVAHATPVWIVPVVGLLDVPLAMPSLALPPLPGLMILCLAVGLFFAIPLFTLIFSRLVFEPPLPIASQPTLLILLAPFAVGTSTYIATTGQVDLFAKGLYGLSVFMLTVLAGRLRHVVRCCPFRVSWWAVGFPLSATAIAALHIAAAEPGWASDVVALVVLTLATIVIAGLLVRTLLGVVRGELRAIIN